MEEAGCSDCCGFSLGGLALGLTRAATRRNSWLCAHSELLMFLLPLSEPVLLEDCLGWWMESQLVAARIEAGK